MRLVRHAVLVLVLCAAANLLASDASAIEALKGKTYYFGTHPARTTVTFVSDADLETIHGITHLIGGKITVDAAGKKASGGMRIRVADMRTGIAKRDEHLRSEAWLDARRFPFIRLQLVSATEGKDPRSWSYVARLTVKAVTKEFKGTAKMRAIPAKLGAALGAGTWVRVQTEFTIKLSDFGIKIPKRIGSKVSDSWQIGIDAYGTTAAPPKKGPRKR